MQVMSRQESVFVQFANTDEQQAITNKYKAEGWGIMREYYLDDLPCTQFTRYTSSASIPQTVGDIASLYNCQEMVVKCGDDVFFFGKVENFYAGIENSLHYSRLARRRVASCVIEKGVLRVQIDMESAG